MAGIRRLPSGKWQATVRLPDGRRLTKTDPLKGFVRDWAHERELEIARGLTPVRGRPVTVAAWVDRWESARVVEPATRARDRAGLGRIRKHWRRHMLGAVQRIEVQAWVQHMTASGIGPAGVRSTYSLFASAMKAATLENPPLIPATPCVRIDLPPMVERIPPWFTEEEVGAMLAELPEPHRAMVELMVWCGLRWQEAAGLRLVDVDWLRRRIRIVGAMANRVGWREYPKTRKSRRELPVPAWVVEDLSAYVGTVRRETARSDPQLVFLSARVGAVPELSSWQRQWRKALDRAGVAYKPPHTCRHTAASWLVQAGVPLYDVQAFMGHESFATTQRYAHLAPDAHTRIEQSWRPVPGLVTHR